MKKIFSKWTKEVKRYHDLIEICNEQPDEEINSLLPRNVDENTYPFLAWSRVVFGARYDLANSDHCDIFHVENKIKDYTQRFF